MSIRVREICVHRFARKKRQKNVQHVRLSTTLVFLLWDIYVEGAKQPNKENNVWTFGGRPEKRTPEMFSLWSYEFGGKRRKF